jgi:hypothetical protein
MPVVLTETITEVGPLPPEAGTRVSQLLSEDPVQDKFDPLAAPLETVRVWLAGFDPPEVPRKLRLKALKEMLGAGGGGPETYS